MIVGRSRLINDGKLRLATILRTLTAFATIITTITLFATIFKTIAAFATIFKAITAFATLVKALAAFLALAAFEALANSAAIAALIKAGAVPAIDVEAKRDLFDRVQHVESRVFSHAQRDRIRMAGQQ